MLFNALFYALDKYHLYRNYYIRKTWNTMKAYTLMYNLKKKKMLHHNHIMTKLLAECTTRKNCDVTYNTFCKSRDNFTHNRL